MRDAEGQEAKGKLIVHSLGFVRVQEIQKPVSAEKTKKSWWSSFKREWQ